MLSLKLFIGFVLLVALQRLLELRISRRNEAKLRELGAREHAAGHFIWMQALHTLWLVSILLEAQLLQPAFQPWLAAVAAVCFVAGQLLRYGAMSALGPRWSVRIVTLPDAPPVAQGIYRYLRHPNYAGVALEIAALPLLHSAWRTALVFSVLNALLLLLVRIPAEERALTGNGGYRETLGLLPRFWPKLRARSTS
jgi:methyltransferase